MTEPTLATITITEPGPLLIAVSYASRTLSGDGITSGQWDGYKAAIDGLIDTLRAGPALTPLGRLILARSSAMDDPGYKCEDSTSGIGSCFNNHAKVLWGNDGTHEWACLACIVFAHSSGKVTDDDLLAAVQRKVDHQANARRRRGALDAVHTALNIDGTSDDGELVTRVVDVLLDHFHVVSS